MLLSFATIMKKSVVAPVSIKNQLVVVQLIVSEAHLATIRLLISVYINSPALVIIANFFCSSFVLIFILFFVVFFVFLLNFLD